MTWRLPLFLVLLLIPAVAGQGTASAELEVQQVLDVRDFIHQVPPNSAGPPNECSGVVPVASADGRTITFTEGPAIEGCGESRVELTVPGAAASAKITFQARLLRSSASGLNLFPPAAIADLTIQETTETFIDATLEGLDQSVERVFVPETERIELHWRFEDSGINFDAEAISPRLAGFSVDITVKDPVLTYTGLNVLSELELVDDDIQRAEVDRHMRATATVPDVPGDRSLVFQISNAWSIARVELPDGRTLELNAFDSREEDGTLYLTLPPEVIDAFGPGDYTAVFARTQALDATPVLIPFIIILALAPIGTGILATRGAHRFRARAVGAHQSTARMLTNAIYLVWAGYAALGAFVLIGQLYPLIVSWPIQVEAALVHGGFVVTALAFVVLHLSWRRRLDDAMQEELLHKELTNRDLKRSNDELEQFAYIASHDLQEPLRTVARFTQLLERRYGAGLDEDAREFMAYSVNGAQRMQALLDDLLQYSRIGQDTPMAPVALGDALHRVTLALDGRIQDTAAQITHESLPTVHGDARQLEQVLLNLIGNALKFCAPGVQPRVHVRGERQGRFWAIHVEDNGIGIPEEHRDRIFTVFQRLHARDAYEGTGIGLAICKKIVERHGGTIQVAPGAAEGSRFTFTLAPG